MVRVLNAREVAAGVRLGLLQLRNPQLRWQLFYLGSGADVRLARQATVRMGRGTCIMRDSTLSVQGHLSVGERTFINRGVYLSARERVVIGPDCLFGERVSIHDENHGSSDPTIPVLQQGFVARPVTIGANVWLGAGVVVVAGVSIGDNTVVGAGSVVTKSLPANVVAAGVPARVLREGTTDGRPPADRGRAGAAG